MNMNRKTKFCGWSTLAGCILCMFLVQGAMQTFAIFLPQIVAGTGWSLAKVAQVSTFASTSGFFANLLLGRVLKKCRVKTVLLIGASFVGIHMLTYAMSTNVYTLWFAAFLGGIAIGWGTIAPCSIVITNWFRKYRSLCIAGATTGSMLGSVVLNPAASLLIEAYDWRTAYRILGVVITALALLAILLLIQEDPKKLGQSPYGIQEAPETGNSTRTGGVSASEARRSVSYWLMLAGIFFIGFSTNIENYMPAFWQHRGMSSVNASVVLSCYSLFAAGITLVMSRVNDRLGAKRYVLATSVLFAVSVLVMVYTGVTDSMMLLIVCCVPFAAGAKKACTMTPPLVVADAFGLREYDGIIGLFAAVLQLGIASSNLAIGPLAQISYDLAFTCMCAVNLTGMLFVWIALAVKPYKAQGV